MQIIKHFQAKINWNIDTLPREAKIDWIGRRLNSKEWNTIFPCREGEQLIIFEEADIGIPLENRMTIKELVMRIHYFLNQIIPLEDHNRAKIEIDRFGSKDYLMAKLLRGELKYIEIVGDHNGMNGSFSRSGNKWYPSLDS